MASKLNQSIRKTQQYAIGGISVVLGFDTHLPNGLNALEIVRASIDAPITALNLEASVDVIRLEFEENEALFSDNTVIGANRFPKHQLGMKFSGRDGEKNAIIKAMDLNRGTYVAKLTTGQIVLLGGVNGLTSEKSDSGAGAKNEDFNGYDVLLGGAELEKAPIVPAAVFTTLAERVAA